MILYDYFVVIFKYSIFKVRVMAKYYKISDEFHERLEKMALTDHVYVVMIAPKPDGLEEALEKASLQQGFDRMDVIFPYHMEAVRPIEEYCEKNGLIYDTNISMRSVFANPTVSQLRELARKEFVLGIMGNQNTY